jgi:ERCC4-related helicase
MKAFHNDFGEGTILKDEGNTLVIEFTKGIQRFPRTEVEIRETLEDKIEKGLLGDSKKVIAKVQAALIRSINETWGVFSISSIDLLPHQLWVCNQALKKWPIRYMIADDVGLGKTIEAGLILWPLIASKKVNRLLVLTPASLAEQWQERLRKMFDIRLAIYTSEQDNDKTDFWGTHDRVVAKISTLQKDTENNHRHDRLLSSAPWDLVIVDEAHHLNVEEHNSPTLSYQLIQKMQENSKINSCIFFTGTPHRGKDFGFWSLMKLLDNDIFDPKKNTDEQFQQLSNYLIRNNKQHAVDMKGNKLFTDIIQNPGIFTYTEEEREFYDKLTEFIISGKAYANTKDGRARQSVILVLIALQKIASSSVAAVKSALTTRVKSLEKKSNDIENDNFEVRDEEDDALDALERSAKEINFKLMEEEIESLHELLSLADKVVEESRIKEIIQIIKQKYPNDSVLLFTEYKRTQALMLSALIAEWGEENVGFINGDERITGVKMKDGSIKNFDKNRETTADNFNKGRIKYLVSTEASGEGIDLQESCHVLIHIDLPWNPMRLHQRVGRLSRYGQKKDVEVVSMRNPDTVESRIWGLLQTKISSITNMFNQATDDPEDLMQLVLGMQDTTFYNNLFSEADNIKKENLHTWFNAKTETLGNSSVIKTVEKLVGNAAKFNLAGLQDVPKLDLPDLEPFFQSSLELAQRRVTITENGFFSFITPDAWDTEYCIKPRYNDLVFKRKTSEGTTCGVGHIMFDKALDYAYTFQDSICAIDSSYKYFIYRIYDKITYQRGNIESKYLILKYSDEEKSEFISDETFFIETKNLKSSIRDISPIKLYVPEIVEHKVKEKILCFNSVFREPGYEMFACLWGINMVH